MQSSSVPTQPGSRSYGSNLTGTSGRASNRRHSIGPSPLRLRTPQRESGRSTQYTVQGATLRHLPSSEAFGGQKTQAAPYRLYIELQRTRPLPLSLCSPRQHPVGLGCSSSVELFPTPVSPYGSPGRADIPDAGALCYHKDEVPHRATLLGSL